MVLLLAATLLYFGIVFGTGFVLGPFRVFVLEPPLGATISVLCEAPVLVAVMIVAARWLPRKLHMPLTVPALTIMGLGALALQQLADFAVGIILRQMTPAQILANFATPAGAIYALSLVAFAAMPLVVNRRNLAVHIRHKS